MAYGMPAARLNYLANFETVVFARVIRQCPREREKQGCKNFEALHYEMSRTECVTEERHGK